MAFWRLEAFGCRGTATEVKDKNCFVRAYVLEQQARVVDLAALALWLQEDAIALNSPEPLVRWRLIEEEDWSSSWKQHWQAQEVGDRFLICPAWLEPPEGSDRVVLRLDPGMAFGTGTHATTQLCLEALEMRLDGAEGSERVGDIGCGSGILSIGALLLGAQKVYAVDVDPLAIQATTHNRALNQLSPEQLPVELGSIERLAALVSEPLDGFVCNISADVVVHLLPQFKAIAKPDAWGILSGMLTDQVEIITEVLEADGWLVAALWRQQNWCCFNIRRQHG